MVWFQNISVDGLNRIERHMKCIVPVRDSMSHKVRKENYVDGDSPSRKIRYDIIPAIDVFARVKRRTTGIVFSQVRVMTTISNRTLLHTPAMSMTICR